MLAAPTNAFLQRREPPPVFQPIPAADYGRRAASALLLGVAALAAAGPSFAAEPAWFKGNLHTHSLWSDGNDYPEMIVDWYRSRNYHFLALSDHNILSEGERWIDAAEGPRRGAIGGLERYLERFGADWVERKTEGDQTLVRLKPLNEFRSLFESAGEFILLQGEEITDGFESRPIHINATNLRDLIKPQGGGSVRETIANNLDAVEAQSRRIGRPIVAHLNHPNFGWGVTAEDLAHVVQEKYFEVYNGHPGVRHQGDEEHPSVERLWDIANTIRLAELDAAPLFGLATDDSHNYFGTRGSSPGRGWVMVRARALTPESIVAAIQRGDFYASSGVTLLDVDFDETARELRIEIDAAAGESFMTEFIGTRLMDGVQTQVGEVLARVEGNSPSYSLAGNELYVRATVTSDAAADNPSWEGQTQQAWTQPVGWSVEADDD